MNQYKPSPKQIFFRNDSRDGKFTIEFEDKKIGKMYVTEDGNKLYIDFIEIKESLRGKGVGTMVVEEIFDYFDVTIIVAMAKEDILNGFWSKLKGFRYANEGTDEQEGYLWFEIKNLDSNHISH